MHKQPLLIQDAYDFGPPPPKPRETPWEKLYRFFFGDDVFISYARADAIRYVPSLAARLAAKKHICFFDQLVADPNEDLPEKLKKKILRSTVFVLVGTRGAVASSFVRKEVELFRRTRRPFIPVDVDGALAGLEGWRDVIGVAKIREEGARVRDGDPSPEVINLIKDSFRYTRRSQWLRASLLAGVSIILITAALSLIVIRSAEAEAAAIKRQASSEVAAANKEVSEAKQIVQHLTAEADRAIADADAARNQARSATAAKVVAVTQQKAAQQAMRQAQKLERQSAERASETARREAGSRAALLARELGMERDALTLAVEAAEQSVAHRGDLPDEVVDGITASAMAADYSLPLEDAGERETPLLLISPDGNKILGAFSDARMTSTRMVIWDGRNGKITSDFTIAGGIFTSAFSRDGKRLAALMIMRNKLSVSLWNLIGSQVKSVETVCGHNFYSIHALALDSDGSHVIIDNPASITVCEVATGREEVLPSLPNTYGVAFTPEDEPVVYGGPLTSDVKSMPLFVHFPRSGRTVMLKPDGKAFDNGFAGFGDDGSLITIVRAFMAQGQDRVYVQSLDGDVRRLIGYRGTVASVAYIAGQARVVTLSGRSVRVADVRSLPNFAALRAHVRYLNVATFSPDGRTVLTFGDDGKGRLWDLQTSHLRYTLPITDEHLSEELFASSDTRQNPVGFRTAAFRADSKRIVTSNEKGEIQIWDVDTGHPVCSEPGRRTGVNDDLLGVSFLASGDYVMAAYFGKNAGPTFIDFRDAQTCRWVRTFNFNEPVTILSLNGTTIITASPRNQVIGGNESWGNPEIRLWSLRGLDLRSGAPIQLSSSNLGKVPGALLGISPDGTQRLIEMEGGTLQLWRPGEASSVRLERGKVNSPRPSHIAFSADGTRVAVVSDGEARVWDTRSGKLTVAFKGDVQDTWFSLWRSLISLSSDGSKLLIVGKDYTARIYPTSREDFLRVARRLAGRVAPRGYSANSATEQQKSSAQQQRDLQKYFRRQEIVRLDTAQAASPIDDAQFFIRQHYADFLNRAPDTDGLNYWAFQIFSCGSDATCINSKRISVSAAFFIELEFQQTGSVVYRMYRAAYGTMPAPNQTRANITYAQFNADRPNIIAGAQLDQSTINFANTFVQRPEFLRDYPSTMPNSDFVNKLFDRASLTPYTIERLNEIALMTAGRTRAQVLLDVINIKAFKDREYNPSFVLMQYFGYLRRDPDQGGYDFWLNVLNTRTLNNYRGMVCAFITSAEYQDRFSSIRTRNDTLCAVTP